MRRSPFPILDIRVWRRDPTAFAAELRRACHVLGFFQLRHDAAAEAKEVTRQARRFFALPDRSKLACDYATSPAFRGYMRLGVENTAGAPDIREQVEYAAEGRPAAAGAWPPYERLRGPNQWPEELPELRTAVERYTSRMLGLGSELSSALALALGRETSAFDGLFSAPGAEPQPHWQLKLASYPAADPAAGAGAGVGAHTDSGFLTMLLQDEVGGLQAFTGGDWADVPPAGEEVIVCNLGEPLGPSA